MAAQNKPNELYINRIYDAPVKTVWEAWVDPDKVAKWWGPRGFTITTHSKDVRTGGHWDYIMHGPDGVDYPNKTKYLEVEKYSRMVYDHGANDTQPPLFRVTVTFTDVNGKTKMEMTMALATAEAAKEIKKFIKKAGGDSTWDRLAEYLSPVDNFIINRSFDAPIEVVFDAWTNPDKVKNWLPPTGATMEYINADIKSGGSSFYSMKYDSGLEMFGKIFYKEIQKPNRIVYTQNFCDKEGKLIKPSFAPTWPNEMLTTITLTEEAPNKTRITVNWVVHGEATAEERETFHKAKSGMTQGWTGSFDKLENYLLDEA